MEARNTVVKEFIRAGKKLGKKNRQIKELKKQIEEITEQNIKYSLGLVGATNEMNENMMTKQDVASYFGFYEADNGKRYLIIRTDKEDEILKLIEETTTKGDEDE